jgi:aspartate oxidase
MKDIHVELARLNSGAVVLVHGSYAGTEPFFELSVTGSYEWPETDLQRALRLQEAINQHAALVRERDRYVEALKKVSRLAERELPALQALGELNGHRLLQDAAVVADAALERRTEQSPLGAALERAGGR